MSDEDVLPEHHPLRQYLTDLGLTESTEKCSPPNVPKAAFTDWKFLVRNLARKSQFLFYFADLLRPHILRRLYELNGNHQVSNLPSSSSTSNQPQAYMIFWIAMIPVLISGMLQCSSSMLWLMSTIGCCLYFVALLAFFWLLVLYINLKHLKQEISNMHTNMRQCVLFLQELHMHSTDSIGSEFVCPTHQLLYGLWQCLKTYTSQIVELCLTAKTMSYPDLPFISLPKTNFEFITNQLRTTDTSDRPVLLSDCKMLRELVGILHSELIVTLLVPISSLPIRCVCQWFELGLTLCRWNCASRQITEQLSCLNRMRIAIESGQLTLDHGQRMSQGGGHEPGSEDSLTPAHRMTRQLLLQLLAAVTKTQELAECVRNPTVTTDAHLSALLSYVKLQLHSCQMCRSDLERLLLNSEPIEPTDSSVCATQPDALFTSATNLSREPPILVPACDLTPEDDVMEDVAVGDVQAQRNSEDPDNAVSILPTMIPLHASVLSELRLAIADRRLEMQQRERVALQKRLQSTTQSQSVGVRKESLIVDVSEDGDQTLRHRFAPHCPAGDEELERFFSVSALAAPSPTTLGASSRWHVPSAVRKRTALFHRHAKIRTTPETTEPPSTFRRSPNPLSGPSFAAALLAQRRTIGYAAEESFTATGTGLEEVDKP